MNFQTFRQAHLTKPFSEQLRLYSDDAWQKIIHHRFVDEIGDGCLDDAVLANYLVQDYAFVDSLIRLVCTAIADAPTMAVRHTLANFLSAVTNEENTYFMRSFEALGVPESQYQSPRLNNVAQAFDQTLLSAAQNGYEQAITTLLVAEWSYRTWAIRLRDKQPIHFYHKEWISLHDNPEFNAFVDWIREQVDQFADSPADKQNALAEQFQRLCHLEYQFFDAAYDIK